MWRGAKAVEARAGCPRHVGGKAAAVFGDKTTAAKHEITNQN
jgi:hypothetical protein